MINKIIIALAVIATLIAGIYYFLDITIDVITPGRYSLGVNGQEDMFVFIPFVLCGLFLTLVAVPILFRNCFIGWSNDNSWKQRLFLIIVIFLIGSFIIWNEKGFEVIFLIPLSIVTLWISGLYGWHKRT